MGTNKNNMSTKFALPSELPQQNGSQTLGKDQLLAINRLAVQAPEYMGAVESLNMPAGSVTVRNYVETHEDVEPVGTVDFNKWVTFKFGNEGFSNLVAAEVCFNLPRIEDSANSDHPEDAGGTAGASTFIDWVEYVGERLLGDDDNPLRFSHSTETLREYTSTGQHIRRRLCQDNEGTSKRASYNNAVSATTDHTHFGRAVYVPLHLPWAIDEWETRQCAPLHAFANEQVLKFKIPPLANLLSTDLAVANCVVASGHSLSCFLRLHYVVTEKAERARFASLTMAAPGLSYMTSHIARETPSASLTGNTGGNIDIEIRNQTNPFHFMAFVVRSPDDLKAVGETGLFIDTYPTRRVNAGTGKVQNPQFTRFLEWDSFQIMDGSNRVSPIYSSNYQGVSYFKGIGRYFPCDISTNIGFFSPCFQPAVENQGLGHGDFTSLNKPILRVTVPTLLATNNRTGAADPEYIAAGTNERRVDVFYFERNKIHMRNGQMIRMYNVST